MARESSSVPLWKSLLLDLYYHGSRPYRGWTLRRAAAEGRVGLVVLFYHRVADDALSGWTLSNRAFARQIDWLQTHFDLISLEEVQRRMVEGRSHRPAVAITFDDGYAENCQRAIPLLVERKIPCTYFATLHNVLSGEPFAHDVALGNACPPNTIEQLGEMANAGIEIGAHCRHHENLGKTLDRAKLEDEVVAARDELAAAVGRPIRYLALPFGHYVSLNSDAVALARRAGYRGLATAYGGYNYPGDDPFLIQRIHVDDSMARLKNRATLDPRKARVPRFRDPLAGRLSTVSATRSPY